MNTQKVELENIELIKNILIININNEELYKNENEIYNIFDEKILSHFTIKGKINDSDINNFISVFVKYYRSLIKINSELYNEIIVANNNKDILYELFKKIILDIIKNNTSVKNYGMNLQEYKNVINLISNEIILFKEITTKEKYFQTSSFLYPISDILFSFERRMIYIPTIMFIISRYLNEERQINDNFNDLREILFEFEKYEIMFQTVLFKGQSLTKVIDSNIFEKVIKLEIINKENIKNLFLNKETMKNYSIPSINEFKNYLKNGRLKDKIVTIVGFRINFYLENKKSVLLINRNHRYNCPIKPTREHIMPQDIKNWINDLKEWTKLDENKIIENHNNVLHLLGNSMTLNNWTNSSASNLEWKKKKSKYDNEPNCSILTQYKGFIDKETNMVVLEDISKKYKWDFNDINIRNNQIIELLLKIYE